MRLAISLIFILRHEEQRRKGKRQEILWRVPLYLLLFGVPTLLRSANAGGAVDVLLRPAAGAADTQEPMLLRATCGAEEK